MENKKKEIIILTSIMVVILIIAILLGIKLSTLKTNDKTIPVNNNQEINNTLQEENIIENTETVENEINNTVNEVVPEENEEENIEENQPVTDPEQEVDKETIEKIENDEEKAIRIAKENWKQGGNVEFTHEQIKDGKHIVYVRDSETHHIATYIIDLETETFEME